MSQELTPTQELALAISSCEEVCNAFKDKAHPCSGVVNWQVNEWKKNIDKVEGSVLHRPEAWTGALDKAKILFLASNPSFNPDEAFPDYSPVWSEEDILSFATKRFVPTDARGFGAVDMPNLQQADRVILKNGKVAQGRPVPYWREVRGRVAEILDKDISQVSADEDYVMTELVHCKSFNEIGVPDSLAFCNGKWMNKILMNSPARLIIVMGKKPAEKVLEVINGIPSTWGSWKDEKSGLKRGDWPNSNSDLQERTKNGSWAYEDQKKHSVVTNVGGLERLLIWLPRPNSSLPRTLTGLNPCISKKLLNEWRDFLTK